MKDWEYIFLAVMLFVMGAISGWGLTMEVYYNRAVSNTRLYYQTTGEFPTTDWVKASEQHTYKYPEQILDTLKEFTLTK